MSEELMITDRILRTIADDRTALEETLMMREAQYQLGPPDEDREEILKDIAEIKKQIEAIDRELVQKADQVAHVLRWMRKTGELISEERDRLKQKEIACERSEERLRNYTVRVMVQNGWKHLKTALNTLFIRGTEAVEVMDPAALDPHFLVAEVKLNYALWLAMQQAVQQFAPAAVASDAALVRVRTEPALSVIKKAIKSGVDVDGADLRLNQHLVCR